MKKAPALWISAILILIGMFVLAMRGCTWFCNWTTSESDKKNYEVAFYCEIGRYLNDYGCFPSSLEPLLCVLARQGCDTNRAFLRDFSGSGSSNSFQLSWVARNLAGLTTEVHTTFIDTNGFHRFSTMTISYDARQRPIATNVWRMD